MGFLPDWRETRACAVALLVTPDPQPAGLAAGFRRRRALRTCFCGMPKSSMFAEMPLDNRTVVKFTVQMPSLAFSGRFVAKVETI
jgi:hypothetical protein